MVAQIGYRVLPELEVKDMNPLIDAKVTLTKEVVSYNPIWAARPEFVIPDLTFPNEQLTENEYTWKRMVKGMQRLVSNPGYHLEHMSKRLKRIESFLYDFSSYGRAIHIIPMTKAGTVPADRSKGEWDMSKGELKKDTMKRDSVVGSSGTVSQGIGQMTQLGGGQFAEPVNDFLFGSMRKVAVKLLNGADVKAMNRLSEMLFDKADSDSDIWDDVRAQQALAWSRIPRLLAVLFSPKFGRYGLKKDSGTHWPEVAKDIDYDSDHIGDDWFYPMMRKKPTTRMSLMLQLDVLMKDISDATLVKSLSKRTYGDSMTYSFSDFVDRLQTIWMRLKVLYWLLRLVTQSHQMRQMYLATTLRFGSGRDYTFAAETPYMPVTHGEIPAQVDGHVVSTTYPIQVNDWVRYDNGNKFKVIRGLGDSENELVMSPKDTAKAIQDAAEGKNKNARPAYSTIDPSRACMLMQIPYIPEGWDDKLGDHIKAFKKGNINSTSRRVVTTHIPAPPGWGPRNQAKDIEIYMQNQKGFDDVLTMEDIETRRLLSKWAYDIENVKAAGDVILDEREKSEYSTERKFSPLAEVGYPGMR